jgi:hypothetical protein
MKAQGSLTSGQAVNLAADTFKLVALKAGTGIPSTTSSGIQFVADATATNAEDTAIYASTRPSFTGVTWAYDASTGVIDWSFSNLVLAQQAGDDGLTRYFAIYDGSVGTTDATFPVVAILDPGQTVSTLNGTLTIQAPTGGLIQFTGGG